MAIDHLIFFIIISVPLIIILWYDRGNVRSYMKLGLIAVVLDIVWDPLAMHFGLWYYSSWPQVLGISIYTLILYVHYLTFCYFFGNKLASMVVKW